MKLKHKKQLSTKTPIKLSKRTKILHKRVPKATVSVVLIFYIIIGAVAGMLLLEEAREYQQETVSRQQLAAPASIKLNTTEFGDKGKVPFEAPEGKSFVVIDITVRNNSSSAFYLAPVIQTFVTDAQNNQYAMSPTVLQKPINAGSIEPNAQVSGQLSYLVPDNAKNLVFHFAPQTEGFLPLQIKLN